MIHVFFGEREVAKIPDIRKDTPLIPVNSAAVVGAGTMGGGIAMKFANAGIPVLLKEADQDALDRGLANHPQELRRVRCRAGASRRQRLTSAWRSSSPP